jgi:predicted outer membrane protein
MGRRVMVAAVMLSAWAGVAYADRAEPAQDPAGPPRDPVGVPPEGRGPLDSESQREGIGPEGTDLGSPATKVKPVSPPGEDPRAVEEPRFSVQQILTGARRVNELEVQAGMLAKQRGQSRAVKRLGADLVREDQAANARLMSYARKHEIALASGAVESAAMPESRKPEPAEPDPARPTAETAHEKVGVDAGPFARPVATLEEQLKELTSARGAAFDSRFAQGAAESHQQTLDAIKAAQESAREPELAQVLETWRAGVQKRLENARALGAGIDRVRRSSER